MALAGVIEQRERLRERPFGRAVLRRRRAP